MVLVRNSKPSSVGLPLKSGGTIRFEPGTHEYDEEKIRDVNLDSKAVRAYLEGDNPVIAVLEPGHGRADPEPTGKRPAAEVKAMIAEMTDIDSIREIARGDDRTTVVATADKRIAELEAGLAEGQGGEPPSVAPPADSE